MSMPRGADHAAGRGVPCQGKFWAEPRLSRPRGVHTGSPRPSLPGWDVEGGRGASLTAPPSSLRPVGIRLQREGGIVLALGTREGSGAGQTSPACTGTPKSLIFRIEESDLLTFDSQAVLGAGDTSLSKERRPPPWGQSDNRDRRTLAGMEQRRGWG